MSDHTRIEWTDATWNPVLGCKVVSPGCTNCYAMKLAGTRMKNHRSRVGLTQDTKAGPVWNGKTRFMPDWLLEPLRWKTPRRVFVVAHGDLFYEAVPDEVIDQVFAVMALCPQHTFQVLTKRPERMREYCSSLEARSLEIAQRAVWLGIWDDPDIAASDTVTALDGGILPNVWLGVSAEDQERANERIPILLNTPAAVRWVSAEPLLGPVDLLPWLKAIDREKCGLADDPLAAFLLQDGVYAGNASAPSMLHWVVCGGESGPGARPMHPDWARSLRDQCHAAGVPFFMKQLSGPGGRAIKDIAAFPEDLRIREYPGRE